MSDVVNFDSPGRLSRHNMVDPVNRLRNPAQEEALLTPYSVRSYIVSLPVVYPRLARLGAAVARAHQPDQGPEARVGVLVMGILSVT